MVAVGHDPSVFVSLRIEAGLSVPELAARAGIARSTVHQIEHGRKPRMATVRAIAKALGKHPSVFLTGSQVRSLPTVPPKVEGDERAS